MIAGSTSPEVGRSLVVALLVALFASAASRSRRTLPDYNNHRHLLSSSHDVDVDRCDPTKCDFGDCWFIADYDSGNASSSKPAVCADGYEPRDLSNVTVLRDSDPASGSTRTFRYFTCCPPEQEGTPILEQCTDKACRSKGDGGGTDCWADGPNDPMQCDAGSGFPFPRHTGGENVWQAVSKWTKWYSHYVCCKTDDGTPPLRRSYVIAELWRAILGGLGFTLSIVLTLSILVSKTAKYQPYNMYIVALEVPDMMYNFVSVLMGCFNVVRGVPVRSAVSSFSVVFYVSANNWLGVLITGQIYTMLRNAKRGQRTPPPTTRRVAVQTTVVYLAASAMGVFFAAVRNGTVDILIPLDRVRLRLAIESLSRLVMAVLPFLYTLYICVRMWRGKLLRLSGRTKKLALYFLRIVAAFFVIWIPMMVISIVERKNGRTGNHLSPLHYLAWYLGSVQSVLTFSVSLTKPDVRVAIKNFVTCRWLSVDLKTEPIQQYCSRWSNRSSQILRHLSSSSLGDTCTRRTSHRSSLRSSLSMGMTLIFDRNKVGMKEDKGGNSEEDIKGIGNEARMVVEEQGKVADRAPSKVRFAEDAQQTIKSMEEESVGGKVHITEDEVDNLDNSIGLGFEAQKVDEEIGKVAHRAPSKVRFTQDVRQTIKGMEEELSREKEDDDNKGISVPNLKVSD